MCNYALDGETALNFSESLQWETVSGLPTIHVKNQPVDFWQMNF